MFRHPASTLALFGLFAAAPLPQPSPAPAKAEQTAVFAGGCFWGMQLVFKHVKGVTRVVAGYSGGEKSTAIYEAVGTGRTGHAESVQVTFDTSQISYAQLLKVLFAVHDPTTLNRQGPDVGTEYRSAIFYANDDQKRIAQATIAQLTQAKAFSSPIVTEVAPMRGFYPAEDYHQDYAVQHPTQPYIAYNDLPKLDVLKRKLPELYREHYGL